MMLLGFLLVSAFGFHHFLARAFTIEFFHDSQCNGTALGPGVPISFDNNGCPNDYHESATGYKVTPSSEDGPDDVVVFYQTDGCNKIDEIAISNAPYCVTGVYGSFQVRRNNGDDLFDGAYFQQGGYEGVMTEVTAQPSATATQSPMYSSVFNTSAPMNTSAPAIAARAANIGGQPSEAATTPQVFHGAIRIHGDQRYKMHQVAHGVFRGVDVNHWDDSIHVKDDTELDSSANEQPKHHPSTSQPLATSTKHLETRDDGYCINMLRCVFNNETALHGVGDVMEYFINKATAARAYSEPGKGLWAFLNKPFVVVLLGGPVSHLFSSAYGGYITAQTQASIGDVKGCSGSDSDVDIIREIGNQAYKASDMAAAVYLPGGTAPTIAIAARFGEDSTPEICGAPLTSPDAIINAANHPGNP